MTGGEHWARSQVAGPAIALMIGSGIQFLWYAACCVLVLFMGGLAMLDSGSGDPMSGLVGGVLGGAMYGFWALLALVVFIGAARMRTLKSYGLAMTSAIMAIVPCFTYICCILMMPFGIWAVVVLMKPEVKTAFR